MKSSKLLFASLWLSLAIFLSNCTPDQNLVSSTEETLTHSNWTVDYYYETQDLTSQYENYRLLFGSTGTVTAQNTNEIVAGVWNKTISADNTEVIAINFNSADVNLTKLSQQWKLVSETSFTMQFEGDVHSTNPVLFRIKKQ